MSALGQAVVYGALGALLALPLIALMQVLASRYCARILDR